MLNNNEYITKLIYLCGDNYRNDVCDDNYNNELGHNPIFPSYCSFFFKLFIACYYNVCNLRRKITIACALKS